MAGLTPRLADLLGAAFADLRESDLQRLVDDHVREDVDLDFKEGRYGTSDSAKREFAADVAAMANNRGGLIIIGVRDENDVAAERKPVELDAGEEGRLRQTAAGNLAPHVPFEVRVVPSDERKGRGYCLILIPASPLRPHAVRKDNDLRYPRRDGTTKRWLAEAEVADMYRDRFRGFESQVSRMDAVFHDGLSAMDTSEGAFIAVAIVPATPGSISISLERVRAVEEWAAQFGNGRYWRGFFPSAPTVRVGLRRFRLGTILDGSRPPDWAYAELHTDGVGFACLRLPDPRDPSTEREGTWVLNELLLFNAARCLRLLGRHAVENAGAAGDVLVEARVVGQDMRLAYLASIGPIAFPEDVEGGRTIEVASSRHTVTLEALSRSTQDLLAAARLVVADLFNAFGSPEVRQVASDGTLRARYFGRDMAEVKRYAEEEGISTTDDSAPGE